VVVPVFETRCGRTWLNYPDFNPVVNLPGGPRGPDTAAGNPDGPDAAGVPGLVIGVAVFRDTSFDSDRRQWLRRAKKVVADGVAASVAETGVDTAGSAGIRPERILVPWQVHSAKVCSADTLPDGEECDGLVTPRPLVMVGVTVADCVPLLAANLRDGVVGAAHCGWRGTAAGIVGEFVDALDAQAAPGASADATRYLIGPSIGPCCYEVGQDMLSHFSERDRETCVIRRAGGRRGTFFDLKAAVIARLIDHGVGPEQICVDNTCTSCQQYQLSSYRAGGRDCGRMLAFVMLTRRGMK
jgi:YfiH family protein